MAAPARSLCLFFARDVNGPHPFNAIAGTIFGESSPAEQVDVAWLPNGAPYTRTSVDFWGVLPQEYAGAGITLIIYWVGATAITGNVRWQAAFRRVQDDGEAVAEVQRVRGQAVAAAAHTYAFNAATDAVANALGEVAYTTITFTDGADMDSVAKGELFVLRVGRDTTHADDTMAGQAGLIAVEVQETVVP